MAVRRKNFGSFVTFDCPMTKTATDDKTTEDKLVDSGTIAKRQRNPTGPSPRE